jgi:radical SAM superfamily enzyme YgiQ (UPF0313 family)
MDRRVTVDEVRAATRLLKKRGIQVGMFIMLGYEGEQGSDLAATVDHLKKSDPDVFLSTVSYPIKGTPYYDDVAARIRRDGAFEAGTDRDIVIRGRHTPLYYRFAQRWMAGEVARHRHWRDGRYLAAARAATSAGVGRLGMALVERARVS